MLLWKYVAVISALLIALGTAIDYLMLRRQKNQLYDGLVRLFVWIDDKSIPDLPKAVSNRLLSYSHKVLGRWPILSAKNVIFCICVSWCITTAAALVGDILDGVQLTFPTELPFASYYVVNFTFDFLTISGTLICLRIVSRTNVFVGFALVAINTLMALFLTILCLAAYLWTATFAAYYGVPGTTSFRDKMYSEFWEQGGEDLRKEGFSADATFSLDFRPDILPLLRDSMFVYVQALKGDLPRFKVMKEVEVTEASKSRSFSVSIGIEPAWKNVLMAGTTFIPVLVCMVALAILLLLKLLLIFIRRVTIYFIELITEGQGQKGSLDFRPGAVLGALLGLLLAISNGILVFFDR